MVHAEWHRHWPSASASHSFPTQSCCLSGLALPGRSRVTVTHCQFAYLSPGRVSHTQIFLFLFCTFSGVSKLILMFIYTQTLMAPGAWAKIKNVSFRGCRFFRLSIGDIVQNGAKNEILRIVFLQTKLYYGFIIALSIYSVFPTIGFAFLCYRPGQRTQEELMIDVCRSRPNQEKGFFSLRWMQNGSCTLAISVT